MGDIPSSSEALSLTESPAPSRTLLTLQELEAGIFLDQMKQNGLRVPFKGELVG